MSTLGYIALFGTLWCVLAIVWLAGLGEGKPRWMHWSHALAPIAVILLARLLPAADSLVAPLVAWLTLGAAVWATVSVAWIVSSALRNHGIMDVAYPLAGFVPVFALYRIPGDYSTRRAVIVVLMAIWAARLAMHIGRNHLSRGETQPYAKWRTVFGPRWWWWSYFQIYLLQGTLVWIWLLPAAFALTAPGDAPQPLDVVALVVWAVGFAFQAIGDAQLVRFKRDPANRGRILHTGLWSLTRHPNYFGEAMMWASLAIFALAHPLGLIGAFGALYAVWFMAYGSATPMMERHMLKSRPGFAEYAARVPRFVPRLPMRRDQ